MYLIQDLKEAVEVMTKILDNPSSDLSSVPDESIIKSQIQNFQSRIMQMESEVNHTDTCLQQHEEAHKGIK